MTEYGFGIPIVSDDEIGNDVCPKCEGPIAYDDNGNFLMCCCPEEKPKRQLMKELHKLMTKVKHDDGKRWAVFFAILEVVGEEDECEDAEEYLYAGTLIDRINNWLED